MYKFFAVIFVAAMTFGFAYTALAAESIPVYLTDVTINQDSSISVVETISYDFSDSSNRHGIFRNIPYKYKARGGTFKLRISDIKVTNESGVEIPYTDSRSGGDLIVKIGDPDVVVSGIVTYKISYTVNRAINYFEDHDELYWNAIGTDWEVPIGKAQAIIRAPSNITQIACFTGSAGSDKKNCSIAGGNTQVVTINSTQQLNPFEGLTIVAGMSAGTVTKPTTAQKVWDIFLDNGILLLPVIVFLIMLWLWNKYGKDPKRKNAVVAQYESPDKMSALYLGTLAYNITTDKDIAAEVVYLAAHGFLTITRLETEKLIVFKGVDYEFNKITTADSSTLAPQTRFLLDNIFKDNKTTVKLSDLKNDVAFGATLIKIKANVLKELVAKKYYVANPSTVKGMWIAIGVIGGAVIAFILGNLIGYLGAISAIVSGLIIVIFAFIMPSRTQKGTEAAALIAGLERYLSVAEKDRLEFHNAPEKNPQQFELLLPFAIALGVEAAWAAQFKDLTKAPQWYNDSSNSAFNAAMFSTSMNNFSDSMKSASRAVTTASSGGSGFSGGFSGGGGGGGGGGSW